MRVYQTLLTNKDGSKSDTRLILATTPDKALTKARKMYEKRYYSWTPLEHSHVTDLGKAERA